MSKRGRQLKLDNFFIPPKRDKMEELGLTYESMQSGSSAMEENPSSFNSGKKILQDGEGCSKNTSKIENDSSDSSTDPLSDSQAEIMFILNEGIVSDRKTSVSNEELDTPETDNEATLMSFDCSDDLFSESLTLEDEEDTVKSESEPSIPLIDQSNIVLMSWPSARNSLPPLKPSNNHTITFRPHLLNGCAPRPYPEFFRDRWDIDHVKMPCSQHLRYNLEQGEGIQVTRSRWEVISSSLHRQIESTKQLENVIMNYNMQFSGKWNFRGLHSFVNDHLDENHQVIFFGHILPGIIELALELPLVCTMSIPLLKKHMDHSITLSQKQIACLLANAFLCTFPRRNPIRIPGISKWNSEYSTFPDINFNKFFSGTRTGISSRNCEKMKCILNYFVRVLEKEPDGTVTFHRQHIQNFPNWAASKQPLSDAVIHSKGLIESEGKGMLQVDFANRYIGGGVLGQGCIQEEIRFVICPELIVSRLFTECLGDTEALIITGVEQYNTYKGYGDTFLFDGNYIDDTPRDEWGRRFTQVVAIDALHYNQSIEQFKPSLIKRELNKAYAGFLHRDGHSNEVAVATGNWGCGAFRGSPYLKFLIQLMAASQTNRGLLYFTFGDQRLETDFQKMYSFLKEKKLTVGHIAILLEKHYHQLKSDTRPDLFDFIYKNASNCDISKYFTPQPKLSMPQANQLLQVSKSNSNSPSSNHQERTPKSGDNESEISKSLKRSIRYSNENAAKASTAVASDKPLFQENSEGVITIKPLVTNMKSELSLQRVPQSNLNRMEET